MNYFFRNQYNRALQNIQINEDPKGYLAHFKRKNMQ